VRWLALVRHALSGLARAPLRAALTALGVAIASGALVSMIAFAVGFQRQLEAPFESLGLLHQIRVRVPEPPPDPREGERAAAGAEPAAEGDVRRAPPPLDEAALARLRALPGVEFAGPDVQSLEVGVRAGEKAVQARALGLPREVGLLDFVRELVRAGSFFSLAPEPEALLGSKLAAELGFARPEDAIGKTVTIEAKRLALAGREVELAQAAFDVTVCGVYEPPGFAFHFGSRGLLLPLDQMHRIPGLQFEAQLERLGAGGDAAPAGFEGVLVGVTDTADVPRVERAIQALGYRTSTMLAELEEARAYFLFVDVVLAAVGTVALIVAGLGILNTLLVTVLERTAEIGVYKALGASDGDVRLVFLAEAAVLGALGGVGGLGLAAVVTAGLQLAVDAYARSQDVIAPVDVFRFPLWLCLGSVAFAVAVSVASGLYPASRAARVDPIRALRSG
jgi:putative ABC transport system permease protein